MPHIIVKMYKGRTEQQKKELTEKIVKNVVEMAECKESVVSVAVEEFEPTDWADKVYQPDIIDGPGKLYKKPGYNPFSLKTDNKSREETPSLMTYVRGAAELAAQNNTDGIFDLMSWLDLELEDNPQSFDPYFDTHWNDLSDSEKGERTMAIRRVL